MGAVGFLYESVKDNLLWEGLDLKEYVKKICDIGRLLTADEKEFEKIAVKYTTLSDEAIAATFKKAFGVE